MVRFVYSPPVSEEAGIEQLTLLCQSNFNGQRPFDPLQDAFGDWDPND